MKEKEELQNLSTEEIQKKIKTTRIVFGILAGMIVVLLLLNVFLAYVGKSANFVTPLALSPILLLGYNSLKKMKEELAKR